MKKMLYLLLPVALTHLTVAVAAHPCEADARQKAEKLLALHLDNAGAISADNIDQTVRLLKPVKALKGDGRFDVLEVDAFVTRATYRTRFIYAQINDTCLLMGQEILEVADPY